MSDLLRTLPSVDRLLGEPALAAVPRPLRVRAIQETLDAVRVELRTGKLDALPDLVARVRGRADALVAPSVRPVINATGVVLHTNLGRAPWHPDAVEAAAQVAGRPSTVELDLATGQRGGRAEGVTNLVRTLTGAEDALIVNNGAAAVLLAISALARGRKVIVSRGELVEIGGSFRVPEILEMGGATLVEVGTTNRTRAADYRRRIDADTALLLRVHRSNFRIVGFTETPTPAALAEVAHAAGLPLVEDLGSGTLTDAFGEPGVTEALAAGVDLVTFSGDKLLGGPQAGLIAGRADLVGRLRQHPLYRALRVDKVTLAAMEATLRVWERGERPPAPEAIAATAEQLHPRAAALARALAASGHVAALVPVEGRTGGGALPEVPLPGWGVALTVPRPDAFMAALREADPPVIARIEDDRVLLDVRTVPDDAIPALLRGVDAASHPRVVTPAPRR